MLWNDLVGPVDLILLVTIYAVSTVGITVGYHRLLTHRAFRDPQMDGVPLRDPRIARGRGSRDRLGLGSPQAHLSPTRRATLTARTWTTTARRRPAARALARPRTGWLFNHGTAVDAEKYAPDLVEDRGCASSTGCSRSGSRSAW